MISFHHIAISSSDKEKSTRFYEHLGFRTVLEWAAPDGSLRIVHMKLGQAILEIFNYSNPEAAPESMQTLDTDLRRIGTKHFGLKVPNIEVASDEMTKLGLGSDLKIRDGRTGIRYFFIQDPDGNWVEIVQDDRGL